MFTLFWLFFKGLQWQMLLCDLERNFIQQAMTRDLVLEYEFAAKFKKVFTCSQRQVLTASYDSHQAGFNF